MNDSRKLRTGLAFDTVFTEHVLHVGHPESPERLHAIACRLKADGLWGRCVSTEPVDDPYPHIRAVHSGEHCASVRKVPVTGRVAARAVAAVLGAVDAVMNGTAANAFCAVRPPGHHAHDNGAHYDGLNQGQGFCFYNNVAVAARYAQHVHGCGNVLIVDWDFHHGNGTEWFFKGDESVLYFSTHNRQAYPGPGGETGAANCIDVHVSCGCTADDIETAWRERLLPRLPAFKPGLVCISAGFDSRIDDPLGCYSVTDDGFRTLTGILKTIAAQYCDGKIVSVLEGGYQPDGVAAAVAAHVSTLMG